MSTHKKLLIPWLHNEQLCGLASKVRQKPDCSIAEDKHSETMAQHQETDQSKYLQSTHFFLWYHKVVSRDYFTLTISQ